MKARRYSECANGEVTVTVTPDYHAPPDRHGKPAYKIRVAKRGMKPWAPKDPLYSWLNTRPRRRGDETLFDDAVSFFDYYRCGEGRGEGLGRVCRTKACRKRRRK